MKRALLTAFWVLTLLLVSFTRSNAAPLVLSKDVNGHISPASLNLVLTPHPGCDATQTLIPDGSTLVSDRFAWNVDDTGVGYFAGIVRVLTPDAKVVFAGFLHGTIGLTTNHDAAVDTAKCILPGHLEGMLNGLPGGMVPTNTDPSMVQPVFEVNFVADLVPQTAGPVPVYKGHLDGLYTPAPTPPPPGDVLVQPDRLEYRPVDTITATVANKTDHAIQTTDGQSDCTIVQLQRFVNNDWKTVEPCLSDKATTIITIRPGESVKALLPPPLNSAGTAAREPGLYRLAFIYQDLDANGQTVGDPKTVTSPKFKIVAPPPPTPAVKVFPDRLVYGPDGIITATVANGTNTDIYAVPNQSWCTIVALQRRTNDAWTTVAPCTGPIPAIVTVIKAGETATVKLPPNAQPNRDPGTYRLAFTFTPAATDPATGSQSVTVYSVAFAIGTPQPPPQAVRITTNKLAYGTDEPIIATVGNGSEKAIQANAFYSYCTIFKLQRLVNNDWKDEKGCMLTGGPTITIDPKTAKTFTLPPDGTTDVVKEPGTYRLALIYNYVDSAGTTSPPMTALSPLFKVGTPPPPPTGPVTVTPEKAEYLNTDTLVALVSNKGEQDAVTYPYGSFCTIINLEVHTDAGWLPVGGGCTYVRQPDPVVLKAGTTLTVPLPPPADHPFPPGVYHMKVKYQVPKADGTLGEALLAVSPEFRVVSSTPHAALKVMPDKMGYGVNDPITAIIQNGPVAVSINDMQTFCTIVQAQRLDGEHWVLEKGCPMARMPIPRIVRPGELVKVQMPPIEVSATPNWTPGRYRLAVTFAPVDANAQPTGPEQTVTSEPFPVGITPPPFTAVTIAPDRLAYGPTDPITAIVTNGSDHTIVTYDHQSYCGIVTLQMRVNDDWKMVAPCMIMTVSRPVYLNPGQVVKVGLPPEGATPKNPDGVYRLVFTYTFPDANGMPFPNPIVITSPVFTVTSTSGVKTQRRSLPF